MSVPVWNARKCLVCGKSHPQWQMMPIDINAGGKPFHMGWACRNKNCQDTGAIEKALEKKDGSSNDPLLQ
jgi:predicted RNA-binding protein YlxR (DUF448 family)